ncbi:hypothetical protein JD969_07760 [Planctomycetota bacterium]|nr:hypothetical protein JD969_07760 [Planctomycetota bacterium]
MSSPSSSNSDSQYLIEMCKHRHLRCPSCTYDLYQIASSTCPRCKQELQISLAFEDVTEFGAYTLGIVSISISIALPFFAAIWLWIARAELGDVGILALGMLIQAAIFIIPLFLWLKAKEKLITKSNTNRWGAALATCLFPPISFGSLFLTFYIADYFYNL